jgi:hypothetical protein
MTHRKRKQTPFVQRIDGRLYEFESAMELQTFLCKRANSGTAEAPPDKATNESQEKEKDE